jgi:GTP-binding protein
MYFKIPEDENPEEHDKDTGLRLAIIGRPNVGKSTLVNRLLGEDRVVAFDQPGTTRDSIYIPFERDGRKYTLIDTAGVRRKGKVDEMIEKFSIVKTLQAMKDAHVVVVVVDAREGIVEQDLHLIGYA